MESGVEGVEYRSEFEACLVPVASPYGDGCLWWKLLFHTKNAEPIWISRQAGTADGEATLHLTTGKTDAIAWIASSVEGGAGKAATASFPGKPRYAGPWASVETKEVSEGDHLGKADAQREAAATLAGLQAVVTIDATANAGSDAIDAMKLRPGTIAGVRFGKQAFCFPINEVDYSFSTDAGWEIKAPVTVETDSIDYRYPQPPEPSTPPEPPEPPVKPKAGLKRLLGNGSGGSIVQDLHGDWWVLCASISSNDSILLSDPRVKKIEGLPADAELIAINKPYNEIGVYPYNLDALFQSGEKTLYVNVNITNSAINTVVNEISLDGAPVSVVRNIEDKFWIVTENGSMYTVYHKKDSNELSVEKNNEPAGLFHPTTFIKGSEDGSILVASSSYAVLLGKPDYHQANQAKIEQVIELEPGETVLASPMKNLIVTSKRVIGLSSEKASAAVKTHGGVSSTWPADGDGCFLGCKDGSLLWLSGNKSYTEPVVAMPPAAGRIWRGVLSNKERILAWGSSGLVRIDKENDFTATIIENSPVLTAAGGAFTTEAGELKIFDGIDVHELKLSFKPKHCWSSGALGYTMAAGKNVVYIPGYTLVAGDSEAALITQVGTGFPFHVDKIAISSPVAAAVKPSGSSFFIRLEDGSLVDEKGKDILAGSIAEGAKVLSIAEESRTGCCLLYTDRGPYRVAATHDVLLFDVILTRPEFQVEKLEGSWGEINFVGNGVMAGKEEAHFGHPAAVVKLASLTTPAVAAEPAGDESCFLLLEDGSVCFQPTPSSFFYRVAAQPEGWKPQHITNWSGGAIAWADDGRAELIEIEGNPFIPGIVENSTVTVLPKLPNGIAKLESINSNSSFYAYALSGGRLFKLEIAEWIEAKDESLGEGSLTDFTQGSPFCLRRGNDWLMALDGKLQKINGISGDFLSRVGDDFLSTTGGAVDLSAPHQVWNEASKEWDERLLEPSVVSTEPLIFVKGGEMAVKLSGGLFKVKATTTEEPSDHRPWLRTVYSLESADSTVKASTVSKRGSTFWLGAEGLTDGDGTLLLTDEQREEVDWQKLASCGCFGALALEIHGLLVPLKTGELAWLKPDKKTVRFRDATAEGLLGIFGGEDYSTYGDAVMLVATSGSLKAAFEGEKLRESPILITDNPKGLRGEDIAAAVCGQFGVAAYPSSFLVCWPALEGLGAVKEARKITTRYNLYSAIAIICEHGLVSMADDKTFSWKADGLRFEPSGERKENGSQILVIRTASGEIWFLSNHELVKTGVSGIIADKESTRGFPITVADSSGLTRLTVDDEGKLRKESVQGSKPATAALRKGWQLRGNEVFVAAYDSATGNLQAATDDNLFVASEPTVTGLTAIGGVTNEVGYGPIVYGSSGVVAVNFDFTSKVTAVDWSEKLAALGLPTADDTGDGDSGELEPTIDPILSV